MKIKNIINLIIFLIISISIGIYLRYDIYEHDDIWQSFIYTPNLWDIIRTADHGRYFSWIYMKLVVHGSSIIRNIHPDMDIVPKIVTGMNIAILSILISLFSSKPYLKKLNPLYYIAVILSLFIIYTISLTNIYRYNQHFAYQSNLIWFALGWLNISYYFINSKIPETKKELIKNSFLCFMLGVTAHFNTISSIGIIIVLTLFFIIKEKNINFIKNKQIYIPSIFFIIANILYFSSPHFVSLFAIRGNTNNENPIARAISSIPDFSKNWFKVVFLDNYSNILILMIIISTLLIILLSKEKEKKIRVIIISLAIIFGVSFFNYSLILTGKSWLYHGDLKVLTRIMFLISLSILIGYIFTIDKVKNYKLNYIISSILMLYITYTSFNKINTYKWLYSDFNYRRKEWYITEKIYRLYSLNNKEAILPASREEKDGNYFNDILYWSSKNNPIDWTGNAYWKYNYPAIYYQDLTRAFRHEDGNLGLNKKITNDNTQYYVKYYLTNREESFKLYSNMGGIFTKEELKELNFNRLFDKNFILNRTN